MTTIAFGTEHFFPTSRTTYQVFVSGRQWQGFDKCKQKASFSSLPSAGNRLGIVFFPRKWGRGRDSKRVGEKCQRDRVGVLQGEAKISGDWFSSAILSPVCVLITISLHNTSPCIELEANFGKPLHLYRSWARSTWRWGLEKDKFAPGMREFSLLEFSLSLISCVVGNTQLL